MHARHSRSPLQKKWLSQGAQVAGPGRTKQGLVGAGGGWFSRMQLRLTYDQAALLGKQAQDEHSGGCLTVVENLFAQLRCQI